MADYKFSIIVPVYNASLYLHRCVDSLLNQTYENVEILLINDGSTDDSAAICEQYSLVSDKVRVFHKKNGGVSSARNMGIDHARGDYLVFVDSDDCVHRELMEIYMASLEEIVVPVCGTAFSVQELETSYKKRWQECLVYFQKEEFMEFLYADYFNMPWNKLYDAQIIHDQHLRFDESKSLGEDFLFNLEYFRYSPSVYQVVNCPLYYYQEGRSGSLGNSYCPQLFALQKEMFEALYKFLEDCGSWSEKSQKMYYQLYWDRLYLTMHIYWTYAKEHKDRRILVQMADSLKDAVWGELEKECCFRGLMKGKRRWKKIHLNIWRKRCI